MKFSQTLLIATLSIATMAGSYPHCSSMELEEQSDPQTIFNVPNITLHIISFVFDPSRSEKLFESMQLIDELRFSNSQFSKQLSPKKISKALQNCLAREGTSLCQIAMESGISVLDLAAMYGNNVNIIRIAILTMEDNACALISLPTPDCTSLSILHWLAADDNNIEAFNVIMQAIQANCDDIRSLVFRTNAFGDTALHSAADQNSLRMAEALISAVGKDAEALCSITDDDGYTALEWANHKKNFGVANTIRQCLGHITLEIFPSIKFGIEGLVNPDADGLILATLKGFKFTNDLATLTKWSEVANNGSYSIDGIEYDPDTLEVALRKGLANRYPIHYHKQLKVLCGNEQLTIVRVDDNKSTVIDVPANMKNRMLKYLLNDVHLKERQCFDFVKEIWFDQETKNHNRFKLPLSEQIEVMDDETLLIAGDAIVLFSRGPSGRTIIIKHYAIALGNGIYISKFGNGGLIFVSDMESLMKFWRCTGFAKIIPEVADVESFELNAFPTIVHKKALLTKMENYVRSQKEAESKQEAEKIAAMECEYNKNNKLDDESIEDDAHCCKCTIQ